MNVENNEEVSLSEAGIVAGVYIVTAENRGIVRSTLLICTPVRQPGNFCFIFMRSFNCVGIDQ